MSHPHFDVIDCLSRVRGEDREAAPSLVRYLYPKAIGIVRRRLPRRAAEEDLAQEIFVKVFERLDHYKGQVPIIHWVSSSFQRRNARGGHYGGQFLGFLMQCNDELWPFAN